ncbi:MAG: NifB/NifX family molybdenum-iron cluster-binding protein, partial [Pseudomonadota bacterium]
HDDGPLPLLVAVASQNGREVTPHAGRTRKFLLFAATAEGGVEEVGRFELPKTMALHGWPHGRPHPLFAFDAVVAASAGEGVRRRLGGAGVAVVVVEPTDAATAAKLALEHLRKAVGADA